MAPLGLDDLCPESGGPTAEDLARARQILEQPDVLWALRVLQAALAEERAIPSD